MCLESRRRCEPYPSMLKVPVGLAGEVNQRFSPPPSPPRLISTQLNLSWIFIRLLLDLTLLAVDQDQGID